MCVFVCVPMDACKSVCVYRGEAEPPQGRKAISCSHSEWHGGTKHTQKNTHIHAHTHTHPEQR